MSAFFLIVLGKEDKKESHPQWRRAFLLVGKEVLNRPNKTWSLWHSELTCVHAYTHVKADAVLASILPPKDPDTKIWAQFLWGGDPSQHKTRSEGGKTSMKGTFFTIFIGLFRASLVAQLVKNLPAMQETWVRSLGWKDSLKEGMAIHSSILAWRIPRTEEPGGLQSMDSQRVRHDWATKHRTLIYLEASQVAQWQVTHLPMQETWVLSLGQKIPWRRKWQPTPVFLPGESHGQRRLAGYSPWHWKSQQTWWLNNKLIYLPTGPPGKSHEGGILKPNSNKANWSLSPLEILESTQQSHLSYPTWVAASTPICIIHWWRAALELGGSPSSLKLLACHQPHGLLSNRLWVPEKAQCIGRSGQHSHSSRRPGKYCWGVDSVCFTHAYISGAETTLGGPISLYIMSEEQETCVPSQHIWKWGSGQNSSWEMDKYIA